MYKLLHIPSATYVDVITKYEPVEFELSEASVIEDIVELSNFCVSTMKSDWSIAIYGCVESFEIRICKDSIEYNDLLAFKFWYPIIKEQYQWVEV